MKSLLIALLIVFTMQTAIQADSIETKGACSPVLTDVKVAGSIRISCPTYPGIERILDSIRRDNQLSDASTEKLIAATNIFLESLNKREEQVAVNTSQVKVRVKHIEQLLIDLDEKPLRAAGNTVNVTSNGQSGGFTGTVVGTVNVMVSSPNLGSPLPLSEISHPSPMSEAASLLSYLKQLVDADQVKHVRLQAVFTRIYFNNPIGAIDWVEALAELQRLGRVSNVSVIDSSWTYNGFGISERFPLDYAFDIGDVQTPLVMPSAPATSK